MAELRKIEGIVPSACVPYTDASCRTIDEDALRQHLAYMLKQDIGALVIGGHMAEAECLTRDEKKRLIDIALEVNRGKVPLVGGVNSSSTREAIEQGLDYKEWGAQAVLFTPPNIADWNSSCDDRVLLEHFSEFDRKVDIPFILMSSPLAGGSLGMTPGTLRKMAQRLDNFVAMKILTGWNTGAFTACCRALKSVRDIGCLIAGSSNLFGTLVAGGDGNLSGAGIFLAEPDVQIFKAVKSADLAGAKAIADRYEPVTDVLDGYRVGLDRFLFHYRFKVGAWLMGLIPCPQMRRPQIPPPREEIERLREAMIAAGMAVVREAEELSIAEI